MCDISRLSPTNLPPTMAVRKTPHEIFIKVTKNSFCFSFKCETYYHRYLKDYLKIFFIPLPTAFPATRLAILFPTFPFLTA